MLVPLSVDPMLDEAEIAARLPLQLGVFSTPPRRCAGKAVDDSQSTVADVVVPGKGPG